MGAQATQELFKDGYVITGDIMEQQEANKLVWMDRRKNIMKLAQGEYVSVFAPGARLHRLLTFNSPDVHLWQRPPFLPPRCCCAFAWYVAG